MTAQHLLFFGSAVVVAVSTFYGLAQPSTAARVIDGDTIAFGDRHVRLWGIDAPELSQVCQFEDGSDYPCGNAARVHLQSVINGRPVTCTLQSHDQYGREVSVCTVDMVELKGIDLAEQMVTAGWALDWPRYSAGTYAGAQAFAKLQRLGMWRGTFEMPWEYRWRAQPK